MFWSIYLSFVRLLAEKEEKRTPDVWIRRAMEFMISTGFAEDPDGSKTATDEDQQEL